MSEEAAAVTGPPANLFSGIVKAIRPRQWVKNLLVLAAPRGRARRQRHLRLPGRGPQGGDRVHRVLAGRVSIYLVNDARDVEADRAHPTKRFRPIAAGVLPVGLAYGIAVALGVASLAISWWLTPQLAVVMAVYLGVQLAYCFGLKHQAVLDICIVSSASCCARSPVVWRGHSAVAVVPAGDGVRVAVHGGRQALRRAAAGRTDWRQDPPVTGELHEHVLAVRVDAVGDGRRALLRAVGLRAGRRHRFLVRDPMIPFTIAILRYAVDVDGGMAGEPEEIALRDRVLQLLALAWIGSVVAAVVIG